MRSSQKHTYFFQGDFLNADIHRLHIWQHSLQESWPLYPFATEESMRHHFRNSSAAT